MPGYGTDPFMYLRNRAKGWPTPSIQGGGVPWTPLDLGASLYDMWDAERADSFSLSGAAVNAWASVKNGYSASQSISAAKPIYSATSFNSRPGVTHDSADDELTFVGVGTFPVGATGSEIWSLSIQSALPADTGTRTILGYGGGSVNSSRSSRRTVVSGVNRAQSGVGIGGSQATNTNLLVDLSGIKIVRSVFSGTEQRTDADGTPNTPTAAVPATDTVRLRIGAGTNTAASNFWHGVFSLIAITAPLTDEQAAQMLTYLKSRGGIA